LNGQLIVVFIFERCLQPMDNRIRGYFQNFGVGPNKRLQVDSIHSGLLIQTALLEFLNVSQGHLGCLVQR
jgi:hypothetical protein